MGTTLHNCPYCGATNSTFLFRDDAHQIRHLDDKSGHTADLLGFCSHCPRAVLFELHHHGQSLNQPKAVGGNISKSGWSVAASFPASASTDAPPHTPTRVARPLSEALKGREVGIWAAAGLMARKAIEMALAEKQGADEVSNLKAAIADLRKSGDVPEYVADWGDHVRALGNDAAHRSDFEEAEARDAVLFAEELVKTLFTRPEEIRLARKRYEGKEEPNSN